MRDPAEPVIDDLLAALDPPGALHPGLARHVAEQLRELRPRPALRAGAENGVALCEPYLRGFPIDGVAISTIGSSFHAETVATSDLTALRLDEIQLDLGEGPCWDAITSDAPVSVPDTTIETRWPVFADAVSAIGVRAVFAFPLVFAGLSVGAVDVYSRTPGSLADTVVRDITAASTMTSLRVLTAVLSDTREEESSDPRSRRIVHQAMGVLLAHYRTTPENALLLLRAHAFAHDRSVTDVADDIVHHRHAFPGSPLTTPEAPW
ncbi:ANTAR domain-containing protein [Rathayibacter sp. PhB151]|uniref:GAF and ANTAR domain-containing protein n=1 Tax=Rathayibacter sp. PhB151 TaxID=2485189 RepID=UPI001063505F|nr:GAF and ANTAR domain-containing protein [Rathayibacter sp. PhB151]TDX79048.1 ANTAR domain-containing protein [Rathayibacter sp. PhB151]